MIRPVGIEQGAGSVSTMGRTGDRLRRPTTLLIGLVVCAALAAPGCGDDCDCEDSTTTEPPLVGESSPPSAEFCGALGEYRSAEDGAQRNTAIGGMQAASTGTTPEVVTTALETLLIGDLDTSAYDAADGALEGYGASC